MNQLAELENLTSAYHRTRTIKRRLGGADGNQTHDLLIANEALYQLSYRPKPKSESYARTSAAE